MKKALSMVLATALMVTLLAGCGGTKEATTSTVAATSSVAAQSSTAQPQKEVEVKAILYLNPEIELKDNAVVAEIAKKTGVKLNIEAPSANDYWERVKILVAAGDTPDLFEYGSDVQSTQWAKEGILADVTDLVKDYPNLMKNIDAAHWKDTEFFGDGKLYGVTRPSANNKFGYMINQKWLDKLGLKAPNTIAEMREVAKAFTTKDPDGNGKADTFGLGLGAAANGISGNAIWSPDSEFITAPYGTSWFQSIADKDGEYRLKPFTDNYKNYLNLIRDMYAEGTLDREFITQKSNEAHIEKFAQGRVGIVGANGSNYTSGVLDKYGLNPSEYVFHTTLALDDKTPALWMQEPCSWFAFYMSAKSDKIKDCLKLLDWGNSEEGFTIMNLGIKGVHYNSYDLATRTIDRTPEQLKASSKATSLFFNIAVAYEGRVALEGGSTPEMIKQWQAADAAADKVTDKYKILPTKLLNGLNIDFPDDVMKLGTLEARYVTGQIKMDELDKFLETYKTKTADYAKKYAEFRKANPLEVVKAGN